MSGIKEQIEQKKREWSESARGQAIKAELDLPPRPLTPEEHELLCWILEHGSDEAKSFLPQVEGIRAVRWCDCGCPSIRLEVLEGAPLGASQCGKVIYDLTGKEGKGDLVGLLLFQKAGKLDLLEVISVDGKLGPPEFGFPLIDGMSSIQWEPVPGKPNAMRAIKSPE